MTQKYTTPQIVSKFIALNGDAFDYSEVNYTGMHNKVIITHNLCGYRFEQLAHDHVRGSGCPKCSGRKRLTNEEFQAISNIKHEFKYRYLSPYKHNRSIIEIECPVADHGIFKQQAHKHMQGQGCRKCAVEYARVSYQLTKDVFVSRANDIHNGLYEYPGEYINLHTHTRIVCPIHEGFWQSPGSHLAGHGCPRCANSNMSVKETLWLDSLNIPSDCRNKHIRIGDRRFNVDALVENTIYEFYGDYWHGNPIKFAPEEFNRRNHMTYGQLYQKTLDKEVVLKAAGYNLITIWESDWTFAKQRKRK